MVALRRALIDVKVFADVQARLPVPTKSRAAQRCRAVSKRIRDALGYAIYREDVSRS
jgi:hypothetical protein